MANPYTWWDTPPAQHQPFSRLRRIKQIDDVHCGPAVLQMLLSHIGVDKTQDEITRAAHAEDTIDEHGTRPSQLAQAVRTLAPQAQLWVKEYTTTDELEALVDQFQYPVGVEWQNLFYDSIEEEMEDTDGHPENHDFGHYSVVSHVDKESDEVVMIDPYYSFQEDFRYFSLQWFLSRWWDLNQIKDEHSHYYNKRDERLCFIVTLKGMPFPKMFGMRPL